MGLIDVLRSILVGLFVPRVQENVLDTYWPAGLVTGPLRLTDVEDESVDLERDIAWPVDRLSVN